MKAYLRKFLWKIKIRSGILIGRLTVRWRMRPDFLIIGVQKGGTSSLFYYLKFHPQIRRPIKKEVHYFNMFFDRGLTWYLAHFPLRSSKHITGEASPDYIFHPDSPQRVNEFNPDMKLILLLRDPIKRAYSAYQMNRRMGIDKSNTFEQAIQYELDHKDEFAEVYNYERHNLFYLERGLYAQQIEQWTKVIDKKNLLVINSNDFFSDTNAVLKQVYHFLNIEVQLPPTLKPMNVGSYPPLSEETYTNIQDYFKADAHKLKTEWQIEF